MAEPVKIPLWEPPLRARDHITQGVKTREFEEWFADFVGADFAVACTSGTVALFMALKALGIKTGDEVVLPDLTAPGTLNAVTLTGATPVLVDIDCDNLMPRPFGAFREIISKARIPVHFNGRVFRRELYPSGVIEDACHALGCEGVGWGELTCYSFSPTKSIHTGQGGMVTTNNRFHYDRLVKIRQEEGNFKFSDLQAHIGIEYMGNLSTILRKKRAVYEFYRRGLEKVDKVTLLDTDMVEVPWLVDIMVENNRAREGLREYLAEKGVETRVFYTPLHVLCGQHGFPFAESASQRGLWLPSSVHISDESITYVCDKIKEFFECESSSLEPQAS